MDNPWKRGKYRKQAEKQEAFDEDQQKRLSPTRPPFSGKQREDRTRVWQKWDKVAGTKKPAPRKRATKR